MNFGSDLSAQDQWKLAQKIEQLLDGSISANDLAALNQQLRSDPAAHDYAARLLHLHGEMKAASPSLANLLQTPAPKPKKHNHWRAEIPWIIAAAACLALLLVISLPSEKSAPALSLNTPAETVATLTHAKNCRWAESSLPTVPGSAIGPGHYELVEGMATFLFASGAEIVLEAPSTLEIIDALNCRLRKGALMADVPESAIGFTVDTPDATVVDYGTKFGVSAGDDGYYVVQVLDGLVEVTDKNDRQTKPLNGGERISVGGQNLSHAGASSTESLHNNRNSHSTIDDGWHRITTAYGRGADTFIQLGDFTDSPSALRDFGKHPIIRIKRADEDPNTNRKAYLRFDLGEIDPHTIAQARLELTIVPAEIGFASFVPDATFTVHGLTDESQDLWNETSLTWENAPAHLSENPTLHLPEASASTPLGSFIVPQGQNNGVITLEGKALVDFLKNDTNQLVTLIICRETDETHKGGLAHEFATRENRTATAPTLKFITHQ